MSAEKWDAAYLANTQMSVWPWSDLISYVNKFAKDLPEGTNLLELGFGTGANLPFFLSSLKFNYFGIEQSEKAFEFVCRKFPAIASQLRCGNITENLFPDVIFGLVVDRATLTHNTTSAILQTLKNLTTRMSPGGIFIGIDWFSKSHADSNLGIIEDEFTRTNIQTGQFANLGSVHFSDTEHLKKIFNQAGFEIVLLEHKLITREIPHGSNFGSFNFVARLII